VNGRIKLENVDYYVIINREGYIDENNHKLKPNNINITTTEKNDKKFKIKTTQIKNINKYTNRNKVIRTEISDYENVTDTVEY